MIESLTLFHFRCYTDSTFSFTPLNLIVGDNGAGKTNILEALAILSLTTSWRTRHDHEVVGWEHPFCRISSDDREVVIQRTPYMKRYTVNGVSKKMRDILGEVPSVIFQPDDMHLLYGSPSYRRQYIDRLICQISLPYTQALHDLSHLLKQRNSLLRTLKETGTRSYKELEVWDTQLTAICGIMTYHRQRFIQFMNARLPVVFQEILGQAGDLVVDYHHSPSLQVVDLSDHLARNRYKEVASGVTLYGPHREDMGFMWNGHPVEEALSRGQARSLVVALKIVEIEYLDTMNERKPMLLLDDVLSELDHVRRSHLLNFVGAYQTFITGTEVESIKEAGSLPDFNVIALK